MPGYFQFEREERDGIEWARWLGEPAIPGWERADLWGSVTPRFVFDYSMDGSSALLFPALLGLVWHLTAGLERFALPVFDGIVNCEQAGRPYELVRWDYGIDWERADWRERDRGFVPAESLQARADAEPGASSFDRPASAALAPVSTWSELMSIMPKGDQANTTCLFCTSPAADAHSRLLNGLRAAERPAIDAILPSDDDVFAVITHEDEGLGLSSLVIAGRRRIRRRFSSEASQLEGRLVAYLDDAASAQSSEDWYAAIDRLADLRD